MAGATLSSMSNALKINYYGAIIDRLNNATPYYSALKKESEQVTASGVGLKATFPVLTRNNQGIGLRAEAAALPSARQTTTIQLEVPLKYMYGQIKFTGQAMAASAVNATRFAEVVDLEIKSMTTSMKNEIALQVITPAQGYLGIANGAGGGSDATVTVDGPGTIWLRRGMPIQTNAMTTSAGISTISAKGSDTDISHGLTEATAHQVGTIAKDKLSFELEDYTGSAITTEKWSTNRYIFRYGEVAAGTTNYGMHGLLSLIDSYADDSTSSWFALNHALITIQNQSRDTYKILDANIIHSSNSVSALSEDLIQELLDQVSEASGEESHKGQMMIMDYAVRRTFINLLQADRRYSPETKKLEGGWDVATYSAGNDKIPMLVDRICPANSILFPNTRFLKMFRFKDFDWMNKDGSMFERHSDSSGRYDAWTATMFIYEEQGCTSFQDQGALRDVATL